tara:strand:+ start:716 stop:2170 length:1455 start_codon:yes stop_codon:yes gene_type:complete
MSHKLILGDGLLGSELHKLMGWDYISRKKDDIDFADITTYQDKLGDYDEIINCIAYCNTYDMNRELHWDVNYKGVVDLTDFIVQYNNTHQHTLKLIHVSTDYIYSNSNSNASENDVPVHCENWYGYTKLLSDAYVQLKLKNSLILRGTHKETPFQYEKAFINQIGNFDYVDKIAIIIKDLIEGGVIGIYNIGTELKTMYDLARETSSTVKPSTRKFHHTMPSDTSINVNKLNKFLNKTPRACHVISFYGGLRRKSKQGWLPNAIKLLKYINKIHTTIDGGMDFDIIIVNNESDNSYTDELLNNIDGTPSKNGMIKVIHRENIGISYGAFNHAYQLFKDKYDYWFFTEDDIILNKTNWYKAMYDELINSMENDDTIVYVTPNGINSTHPKSHVFNGCGLTHSKYLEQVCSINSGELPHGKFIGMEGFHPDKMVAINTEINFTNIFIKLGYTFKDVLYDETDKIRYVDSWWTAVGKIGIKDKVKDE